MTPDNLEPNRPQSLAARLAASPGDYQGHCVLALAYQNSGHLAEARLCYEAALAVAPPSVELSHNLGIVCRGLSDFASSRKYLEQALHLRESIETLDELALACQQAGDLPATLCCYERVLQIDPRHAQAFAGMGLAFSDAGWEEDAIRAFDVFPMTHHVECVARLVPSDRGSDARDVSTSR